jgi:RNA polymerase sigma-70 factor (ECF subfamily)
MFCWRDAVLDNKDDQKLITLIYKNPQEGLKQAIELYGGAVSTICRNILFDLDDSYVQDAVSDSFLKLWKNAQCYNPEKGSSLKSYIYAIARNTARDKRRSLGKDLCPLPLEEISLPCPLDLESEFAKKTNENIIHNTIAAMDEPERSVYILRYFYFYKIKDIAKRMGMSDKAVENLLYRSRDGVKKALIERGVMYE